MPSIWESCECHEFVWPSNKMNVFPFFKTTPLHNYGGRFRVVCTIRITILFVLRFARYRRLICQQKRVRQVDVDSINLLGRKTNYFVNCDCPLHECNLHWDSIAKYFAIRQHSKFRSVKITKLCFCCHLQILHGASIGFVIDLRFPWAVRARP